MVATEVFSGDDHYYGLCALFTVVMQLTFFFVAYACKFDLVTDFAGSTNFIALAWLSISLAGQFNTRQIVLTCLLTLTRAELALFLLYRVLKREKDARFDETRENFWKFLGFWTFQMIWAFSVTLPVVFVNADTFNPDVGAYDYVGWSLFAFGFIFQVGADMQKYAFRADESNKGKFCDVGFWKYSRHPNYAGEIFMWWGIWISALPVIMATNSANGWGTIASPLITMVILIFGSGVPFAEGSALARYYSTAEGKDKWERYRQATPPILPCIPSLYSNMPLLLKRVFCFEYPFYEYSGTINEDTSMVLSNP